MGGRARQGNVKLTVMKNGQSVRRSIHYDREPITFLIGPSYERRSCYLSNLFLEKYVIIKSQIEADGAERA